MVFWKDFTISYVAGVVGALVILFSLDNNNTFQPKVFWFNFIALYIFVMLIALFINWKYQKIKKQK